MISNLALQFLLGISLEIFWGFLLRIFDQALSPPCLLNQLCLTVVMVVVVMVVVMIVVAAVVNGDGGAIGDDGDGGG